MPENASNSGAPKGLWRTAIAELTAPNQYYSKGEDDPAVPKRLARCLGLQLRQTLSSWWFAAVTDPLLPTQFQILDAVHPCQQGGPSITPLAVLNVNSRRYHKIVFHPGHTGGCP